MQLQDILMIALFLSEALALVPQLKANSILQLVTQALRALAPKKLEQIEKKEEEKK